ncbi:MAG TPA: neutral/alkaline non-lysosomal ceramidase N-terminal domain-containing protein [Bryobacteraceae bacterium]|nr:neutral/alkaline non-lysosomal ceramidase N-terminal domain-containing protein [Bryobacteraceae bacterium]
MGSFRLVLALVLLGGAAAGAQNPGWRAGAATVSITPREPIWMAGFAFRKHPSEGVRQDLHLKALALEDQAGKVAVLVTADLVDTDRYVWDVVADRCQKQFGLTRDRLVFNEAHTHSAPVVTRQHVPAWYPVDEAQAAVLRRYVAEVTDKAVDVVGMAIRNLAPATLEFGQGFAGFAVNRRRVRDRSLPGPVDHDVPVLRVRDAVGTLRAVVVGYACHATALSDYQIGGDWPGYAQEEIEKAHPGATALFVQGCGADSNPLPRNTVELAQRYGRVLAAAVQEVLGARMKPLSGPLETAFERVDLPLQKPPTRAELEARRAAGDRSAERLLKVLERDGKLIDRYPYPVQVWRFGRGLKFVALGGEVVADYALRLKARHGWDDTWVAGYSNDIFAYIPSARVLKEGGYEAGGAMIGENFPAPWDSGVEEIIVDKVNEMVESTSK